MKPTTQRKTLALAVAMTTLVTASMHSTAVLAESSESFSLEEVVVTARRRTENLQDVPMAVTAISGDALTLRGAGDISELAQSIPSLTLEPSRATNSTLTAFIRGVGQQDPLAGFEQGVALYLDDVYLARPQGAMLDIYDVERIEVLRGPQGTLYGRNAIGGAIKYVTRRLGEETEVRLKGSYGSYNQVDLVGTVSVPVSDMFRVGGTVVSLTRDGYGDNKTTGDDNYNKDLFAYRASAEFLPNDDWLIRLSYDKSQDDSNAVAGYRPFPGAASGAPVLRDVRDTLAGASDAPSTAGINGNNEVEAEGWMLSVDWSVGDNITLRSITASREDYTESVIDFDSLEVMDFDAQVIYDNEQFSQEFQLQYSGDKLTAVLGAYYLDATASNDFDVVLGQLHPLGFTGYTGGVIDTEAWSLFADLTYFLTDKFSVTLGGRYTDDTRTADVYRESFLGITSPFFGNEGAIALGPSSDYEAEETYTNFSPRINLSYLLNDDITIYGGYSQGWKAGGFDPRGANFVTPRVEEGFDEETLDSYEIGVKSTWLDGRAITNVALFYSEYSDMQIPGSVAIDADGDGLNDDFVGTVTNAGQAEISGIEIEGNIMFTQNFSGQMALSFLDADIKEWIVGGVDISDQRSIQNTPEEMAYIGLTYNMNVGAGNLMLNANWSYKGDIQQFEAAAPIIDQDAYDIVNASIVWTSGNEQWLVGLHGKNLTDEDVKTAGYCFGSGGCPSTLGLEDNTTVFYAPPLTVTATVEFRL